VVTGAGVDEAEEVVTGAGTDELTLTRVEVAGTTVEVETVEVAV